MRPRPRAVFGALAFSAAVLLAIVALHPDPLRRLEQELASGRIVTAASRAQQLLASLEDDPAAANVLLRRGGFPKLVRALADAGRYEEAIEAARRWCDAAPEQPEAWIALAARERDALRPAEQLRALERAAALRDEDAALQRQIAALARRLQRRATLERALERLAELEPEPTGALWELALLALGRDAPDRAEHALARLLAFEPTHRAAWRVRLELALARGDDDAFARWREQAQAVFGRREGLELASAVLTSAGRYERAFTLWLEHGAGLPERAERLASLAAALPAREAAERIEAAIGKGADEPALHRLALALWREAGAYGRAARHARALLAQRPDDDALAETLVQLELAAGDAAAAIETLRQRLAREPARLDLADRLVALLWDAGRVEQALAVARSAAERADDPERWRALAERARAAGRDEEAIAAYERALRAGAPAEPVLAALEETALAAGRLEVADAALARLAALRPDDPAIAARRAELALWRERPAQAAALLERALARRPGDRGLVRRLARAALAAGNTVLARTAYERLLRERPGDPEALRSLAELAAWRSDLAAEARYRLALLARGLDPVRNAVRLLVLWRAGWTPPPAQLAALERAARGVALPAAAHLAAARAWREAHDPERALAHLRRAEALAPDDPAALRAAVELEIARGRPEAAEAAVLAFVQRVADDPDALAVAGRLALAHDLQTAAAAAWSRLATIEPHHPEAAAWAGRLAVWSGRHAEAVPWLERAVELDPTAADLAYLLGEALSVSGAPPALARRWFVRAHRLLARARTPEQRRLVPLVALRLERYREAEAAAAALVRERPDDPELLLLHGRVLLELGAYEQARARAIAALRELGLARLARREGSVRSPSVGAARRDFAREALQQLFDAAWAQGRRREALALSERLRRLVPDNLVVLRNHASAAAACGRRAEAAQALRRLLWLRSGGRLGPRVRRPRPGGPAASGGRGGRGGSAAVRGGGESGHEERAGAGRGGGESGHDERGKSVRGGRGAAPRRALRGRTDRALWNDKDRLREVLVALHPRVSAAFSWSRVADERALAWTVRAETPLTERWRTGVFASETRLRGRVLALGTRLRGGHREQAGVWLEREALGLWPRASVRLAAGGWTGRPGAAHPTAGGRLELQATERLTLGLEGSWNAAWYDPVEASAFDGRAHRLRFDATFVWRAPLAFELTYLRAVAQGARYEIAADRAPGFGRNHLGDEAQLDLEAGLRLLDGPLLLDLVYTWHASRFDGGRTALGLVPLIAHSLAHIATLRAEAPLTDTLHARAALFVIDDRARDLSALRGESWGFELGARQRWGPHAWCSLDYRFATESLQGSTGRAESLSFTFVYVF